MNVTGQRRQAGNPQQGKVELPRRFGPIAVALVFIAVALVLLGESFRHDYHLSRASHAMGPTFFPRIILTLIIVMAALVILDSARDGRGRVRLEGVGRVLGLITITIAYGILISWTGFVISSIAFVIAVALTLGYRRLQVIVPVAVTYGFAVWFLFQKVLLIILPSSPWFAF